MIVGKIMTDSIRFLRLLRGLIKGPNGGPADPLWSQTFIQGPLYFHLSDTAMHFLPTGAGETCSPLQVRQSDALPRELRVFFKEGQDFSILSPSLTAVTTRGYWTLSANLPGSWFFGLSHRLADTSLYAGLAPVPSLLANINGVLKWVALSGQAYPGNDQYGWLYTDTAVQELLAISTGYSTTINLLPLRLIHFRSENQGSGIKLFWMADQDNHPAMYRIERSKDGRIFFPLGEVSAGRLGLSQHSWHDDRPLEPYNYYRLFMEGQGGGSYSHIVRQSFSRPRAFLYPNPVTDQIHIIFPDPSSRSYIDIVNSNGVILRTLFVKTTNCIIGVGDLPTGTYILRFRGTKSPANLHFTKH
jgi:hypothetical protein